MHSSSKYKMTGTLAALFILSAGSLWYFLYVRPNHAKTSPDSRGAEDTTNGESVLYTAAGVTIPGMDTVTLPDIFPENVTLCVEEVFLTEGSTVTEGQKCVKFTDDSIAGARAELEKAVQDADFAYQSREISNGADSIQAGYAHDLAALEAEFALQVYQDRLTQLEMQCVRTENAYQDAREAYDSYLLAVQDNTFYEDYQIGQLKKAYDDAYELYASRSKYWEMPEQERGALSASGQEDYQWILQTLALLREESAEAKEEYELARKSYQLEIENAEFKLHKLLNQLEQAEQDFVDAQLARQKEGLRAKTDYELTAARGQTAENDYHACLIRLADALERLGDARDEAIKNKAAFEQLLGDGYWYTATSGTAATVLAGKGESLAGGDILFALSNPGHVFVSVSIPSEYGTILSVDGNASVTITGHGSFDGVIETIQPIASPDSQAAVSDPVIVIVSLDGDTRALEPGLTASVAFGASDILSTDATPGLVSQMYDLDLTVPGNETDANYLVVEAVYVSPGQHLDQGDPVCRFTQDSVENVRKALTYAQSEALAVLLDAQTDYHIGVLKAGLSHNEALLDGTLAQGTYDNTIARLNSGIMAKILETEQLLTDIYGLQLSLTDDRYQEQQAGITKAYHSAKQQMEKARGDFVTSQVEAVKAFQAARESYEAFISQSELSNQQISDMAAKVYALQDEIFQGQKLMEKELGSAMQAFNNSQTAGETAHARYTDSVRKYEAALGEAQTRLNQAVQKLDDFNQLIGDGTVYAPADGVVVRVGCRRGGFVADMGKLVLFTAEADKQGNDFSNTP